MIRPMLYEWRPMADLPGLAARDDVALEQKLDGVRCMAEVSNRGVQFCGGGGEPIRFAAASQWLERLKSELLTGENDYASDFAIVFDGELMIEDGQFVIFDMPWCRLGNNHVVGLDTPFGMRRVRLDGMKGWLNALPHVQVIEQALLPAEKIALVERVQEIGGEGFVLKYLDAAYLAGRRTSRVLKIKFVHTAECFVISYNRTATTGSARLGVYDAAGEVHDVGGCSLIGKPQVAVGDVVEVAFSGFRSAMVQPRMTRTRPDKAPWQCALSQFPAYSKEIV